MSLQLNVTSEKVDYMVLLLMVMEVETNLPVAIIVRHNINLHARLRELFVTLA